MSLPAAAWSRLHELTGAMRPGGLSLTERALSFCALPAGARVLDVGCGPGATLGYLRQHHLTAVGIDASAPFLRSGRRGNAGLLLAQAVGERLPFASGSLDAVWAECSLSVMRGDQALSEFARVLKLGGMLVLADLYLRRPEGASELHRLWPGGCLAGAWSQPELHGRLDTHGFRTLLWEDHTVALRQLVGQWVMAGGSPGEFWCQSGCGNALLDCEEVRQAISAARPGYFLAVAQC